MSLLKKTSSRDNTEHFSSIFSDFCEMWNWDRWPGDDDPQQSPSTPDK